jgi:hypothetical protein
MGSGHGISFAVSSKVFYLVMKYFVGAYCLMGCANFKKDFD